MEAATSLGGGVISGEQRHAQAAQAQAKRPHKIHTSQNTPNSMAAERQGQGDLVDPLAAAVKREARLRQLCRRNQALRSTHERALHPFASWESNNLDKDSTTKVMKKKPDPG